ncbi:2-oxo acid dehydrogenase subunit E2 [Streptomyces clavifer]|uniref:2-oxo acid dehydrogenase subunit E2 n=1 Tax=Streptomyces clavifer TaxID=68188 RepID=UPI00364C4A44
MAEFTMPSLGADMDEGVLSQWLVHPGDHVSRGDVVAVVETSKSAIEVECFHTGSVGSLLVSEGATVPVGTPLALIETGDYEESASEPSGREPSPPEPTPDAQPQKDEPEDSIVTPLARRLAEKQHIDLTRLHGTGAGGRITRADIGRAADAAAAPMTSAGRAKASPLARRLAAESGVDLAGIPGSGRNGTVRAADVLAAAQLPDSPQARKASSVSTAGSKSASQAPSAVPVQAARTATAHLMARSKREIPHFYLSTTIDTGAALDWMRDRNRALPLARRLIPAALTLKAVARAAREVPELNGHWIDDAFVPADQVRLGVAVSLRGGGLAAPALTGADEQSVAEVMASLKDLVSRARKGRLRASETTDPSISVTNLGDQGVECVFGVIYPPQVALVGLGRITERPAAVNGLLGVRPALTATLSIDHRAADGATGVRFLNSIDRLLQRPEEL